MQDEAREESPEVEVRQGRLAEDHAADDLHGVQGARPVEHGKHGHDHHGHDEAGGLAGHEGAAKGALVLKGGGDLPSINPVAFEVFFLVTLLGAGVLVLLANRLKETPGHVDPVLEGDWLFRPFRVVASLIRLAEPARPPPPPEDRDQR